MHGWRCVWTGIVACAVTFHRHPWSTCGSFHLSSLTLILDTPIEIHELNSVLLTSKICVREPQPFHVYNETAAKWIQGASTDHNSNGLGLCQCGGRQEVPKFHLDINGLILHPNMV
jgi:hypothetical protein